MKGEFKETLLEIGALVPGGCFDGVAGRLCYPRSGALVLGGGDGEAGMQEWGLQEGL